MTGLILLAAGASNRLGEPKQNLIYNGQTLLQRSIATALASGCSPAVLVLGANAEIIEQSISFEGIVKLMNPDWQTGMASSIKTGITEISKHPEVDSAIIMLCDQPFVDPGIINMLIRQKEITKKTIIACRYKNTAGVPALFDRSLFAALRALQGDEGARLLLKNRPQDVFAIDFEQGSIDIDTAEDYKRLQTNNYTELKGFL